MHTDWLTELSCGFTSHSTQNRSFPRRFPQPISRLGYRQKKTKPKTTKACIHRSKEMYYNTNTQQFNGPFPGQPGWAGTRKIKPIWILLKQETVSGSGISWAICKSAPRSRQITMPAPHHHVLLTKLQLYCDHSNITLFYVYFLSTHYNL